MSGAPVIHIGGWPGAGKRTIGRLVAKNLAGRLIDNHLMLDAARAIYDRGTQGSVELREEVRAVILNHARKLPLDVPLVLTDALADEPVAPALLQPTLDLAAARSAPLHAFLLDLDIDENLARLTNPARHGTAKLVDPEVLKRLRQNQRLFGPEGAVTLDVSRMTAFEAAAVMCKKVGAVDG